MATYPPAALYGEIEVGIFRTISSAYEVELRVTDPDSQAEKAPLRRPAALNPTQLPDPEVDPAGYGKALASQLFSDPQLRLFYSQNKIAFDAKNPPLPLRFRLAIQPGAPELHALRWELIADPESGLPLATSGRILFSRVMLHQDWRVITLRPKATLKALIAVSAPSDSPDYNLCLVDKAAEIDRARRALAPLNPNIIAEHTPLTLPLLHNALHEGYDIVYLVSHGAIFKGQPLLYLQGDDGLTQSVSAADFAAPIAGFQSAPRLIVLASCQSAAPSPSSLPALAPLLADAGVPAIIAMQGSISIDTVEQAMPLFFRELLIDGQIDRALAFARFAVSSHSDFWMPVLFLRLKTGRIWYEPGFGPSAKSEFEQWRSICSAIRNERFIPILGPELGEHVFGGTRELANRLAEEHAFPLAPWERADLAKVSQFISTSQKREYVIDTVQNQFLRQVADRTGGSPASLPALLDLATTRCLSDPDDPYRLLAELPASIYLNASYEPMLYKALQKTKTPERVFTNWRARVPTRPQPSAQPSTLTPWVYHIFGLFGPNYVDSLVLTEDDFFDYLITSTKLDLLPRALTGGLVRSSLLFLGFRLDDWRFRVLFRMIVTSDGAEGMKSRAHVGVQVNPDENSTADVQRARKYMESYFQGGGYAPEISIYWGTAAEFLKELKHQLTQAPAEPVLAAGAANAW